MSEVTIWTLDWVPTRPRGFVRDLRLRWACEEIELPYTVKTVAFDNRETNHLVQQPFGQVPFLSDGELQMFESGAALLHLALKSARLIPSDAVARTQTMQWIISALNSIEIVTVPWWYLKVSGKAHTDLSDWMATRLQQMENILRDREWLVADRFTAADLMMADVLRVPEVRGFSARPATEAYITRVTERPAFRKAYADQIAHFERADRERG